MFKRGDSWTSDFWYKGERYIKSHGRVSKTIAKEKDRAFRSQVASGNYKKINQDPPFDLAMDEYLKKKKAEIASSTYERYITHARYLKDHYGNMRISKIEGDQLLAERFKKKRIDQIKKKQLKQGRDESELSFTTINRDRALLRSLFKDLIRGGRATRNPAELIGRFDEVERSRILTEDEIKRIFKALYKADPRYDHLKDIIIVALNTGMRRGEILKIQKDWINLKEGVIVVPKAAQKSKKKNKRVPINSVIGPIIKKKIRSSECKYLFVNKKTGTRFYDIKNAFDGILKTAGIEGKPGVDKIRFHDLRHTAGTLLARAGKDIKFIAQYLGHSDVRTTTRYVNYSDEDLKKGAEILAQVPSNSTSRKLKIA